MVFILRRSLYAGSIAWDVCPLGTCECGLYKQVVFICIYRWSLEQLRLFRIFVLD